MILSLAAVVVVIAGAGATHYTSQSSFCASCHEMQPLHAGWRGGSHTKTECYNCHVDQTVGGHVAAKWNGLKQAYVHFSGKVDMAKVQTTVPDHRCVRCHDVRNKEKFGERLAIAHLKHNEAKLNCTVCHLTSGHAKEAFVGFKLQSCQECHPKKLPDAPEHHLKKPPCTRGSAGESLAGAIQ